jgi:hypothetical protein
VLLVSCAILCAVVLTKFSSMYHRQPANQLGAALCCNMACAARSKLELLTSIHWLQLRTRRLDLQRGLPQHFLYHRAPAHLVFDHS